MAEICIAMNPESKHLSDEEIARYGERLMPPAELPTADEHLASCDSCYARLLETRRGHDILAAASKAFHFGEDSETAHLAYEQLAAFVDNELDDIDREIVTSHLEYCPRCETELMELREIASQMAATPAQPEERPRELPRQTAFREKLMTFWSRPAFRFPALAATAVACLALFAFLISLPLRSENARLQARVAELERSQQMLAEQLATLEGLQNEVAALREENNRLKQASAGSESAVIALNDGGSRITLDAQGNVSGIEAAPKYQQAVKEALQNGSVKITTALRGGSGKSAPLMGDPATPSFQLLAPVNIVIQTSRPAFRWSGLGEGAGYQVTIFDENLNKVAESERLTETGWTATNPFARGRTYIWQVRASLNNRETVAPAPGSARVKFKVIDQAIIEEIGRIRNTNGNSHLLTGILYAEAGLLDDAEREFQALVRANPQSPVARKLLQNLIAKRQK